MTNSYDVDHGLSQDAPGPLEPVEIAQQDDTLARTGNTARDQAMYDAGIEVGEANTKHNAAIREGMPAGWKLVTKKTCYALMHEGAVIATLAGQESKENAAIIARMFTAPGVSTVEDEQHTDACPRCGGSGQITVLSDNSPDAHDVEVCCDHFQGTGAAVDAAKYLAAALSGEKYRHMQIYGEFKNFHRSLCARFGYCHDEIHFRRDLVSLEEAIAQLFHAPAAGDALPSKPGVYAWSAGTSNALVLVDRRPSAHSPGGVLNGHVIESTRFYDGCAVESWGRDGRWTLLHDFAAAIAAQRKGDA